jgi:hypothetical protein
LRSIQLSDKWNQPITSDKLLKNLGYYREKRYWPIIGRRTRIWTLWNGIDNSVFEALRDMTFLETVIKNKSYGRRNRKAKNLENPNWKTICPGALLLQITEELVNFINWHL